MMTTMDLSDDEVRILEIIRQIDPGERPRVMHYLSEMAASQPQAPADPSEEFRMHSQLPTGEPGWKFMEDVRKLNFTPQDLAEMEAAMEELGQIEYDC